jgi:hypothetical protein
MKQKILVGLGLLTALWVSGCSSTSTPGVSPSGAGRQELVAKGDCVFEACSSLPSSLSSEPVVECSSSGGAECSWAAGDPDGTVSYRPCAESECPERPAVECPGDAVKSQACGSENEAGCAWTTTCVPPRETTPCPAPSGCDDQPVQAIGIICEDGSNGSFVCVTDDTRCYWERSCD